LVLCQGPLAPNQELQPGLPRQRFAGASQKRIALPAIKPLQASLSVLLQQVPARAVAEVAP
jgi:hypothetical protein